MKLSSDWWYVATLFYHTGAYSWSDGATTEDLQRGAYIRQAWALLFYKENNSVNM